MGKIYFAYGSNMKIDRMSKRAPSTKLLGYAKIRDHQLVFNKISRDGSGKANIVESNSSVVFGVLFDIEEQDILRLDDYEKGYDKQDITVIDHDERPLNAFTYISTQVKEGLIPFDWYLEMILQGAIENKLPKYYVENLRKFESVPDIRKKK